jgi:hypothetical protein
MTTFSLVNLTGSGVSINTSTYSGTIPPFGTVTMDFSSILGGVDFCNQVADYVRNRVLVAMKNNSAVSFEELTAFSFRIDSTKDNVSLLKRAAKPYSGVGRGTLYCKELGGNTELYYVDSSGLEVQITTLGSVNASGGSGGPNYWSRSAGVLSPLISGDSLSITSNSNPINLVGNPANINISTSGSGNIDLGAGGGSLRFSDSNKSGYSGNLPLSDNSSDWITYVSSFGNVSLLNAVNQAATMGGGGSSNWSRAGTILSPASAGDSVQVNSTSSPIHLYTTNSNINVRASGSGSVNLSSVSQRINFFDGNNSGYSAIPFSTSGGEWVTYRSNFGDVSLLNAVNQAATMGGGGSSNWSRAGTILSPASAGDSIQVNSTSSPIQLHAASANVSLRTANSGDISLSALGGNLTFSDSYTSTYNPILFTSSISDWTDYDSNFGNHNSLLGALNSLHGSLTTQYWSDSGTALSPVSPGRSLLIDSTSSPIQLHAASANVSLRTANSGDISLSALGGNLTFSDSYTSTYNPILFTSSISDWTDYDSNFGNHNSLLGALNSLHGSLTTQYWSDSGTALSPVSPGRSLSVNSSATDINLVAGSASINLTTSGATSGRNINLSASTGNIRLSDINRVGSTYTDALPLASSVSDWNSFVTNFGNGSSLLNSINTAFGSIGVQYWNRTGTVLSPTSANDSIQVNSTSSPIQLHTASADISIRTANSGNISLSSLGGRIHFSDSHTSTNPQIPFASSSSDWSTYVANFGSGTSILNAISQAYSNLTTQHWSDSGTTLSPSAAGRSLSISSSGTNINLVAGSASINLTTSGGTSGRNINLSASTGLISFSDLYRVGSSYTSALPLSLSASDWNNFVTNFGNGSSLLAAINTAYSSGGSTTSFVEGPEMYSSNRGDFTVTNVTTTTVDLLGLPFNIQASNIVAVIRKPLGLNASEQLVRGDDLVCTWAPSGEGAGTLTVSPAFFAVTDEVEIVIDGKQKAYDIMNDANRSLLINPDSIRSCSDVISLSSSDTYPYQIFPMASEGYHFMSLQINTISPDSSIKVYGCNDSSFTPLYSSSNWNDITLFSLNVDEVDAIGSYQSGRSLPYNFILIMIDGTSVGAGGKLVRSAL